MKTVELYDKETETVFLTETVDDDRFPMTMQRFKLQAELNNEGLAEPRYVAREKKESAGE